MLLNHAERSHSAIDGVIYTTKGYIGCCCGSFVHPSFESWLDGEWGIDVFLGEEDHPIPESNDHHNYHKLRLEDGSWVYIKESYIFSKKHKKTFTRNVNRENTNIHPLCCSIYLFYAEDPRWARYLSHWKTLKEKYQYFFFICTNVQLPQMRPVMEEFGNIIYESPHYCVNNNTMTSDRLKLFIAEKV